MKWGICHGFLEQTSTDWDASDWWCNNASRIMAASIAYFYLCVCIVIYINQYISNTILCD